MDVRNATVLVTGANRGIGRALVQALLEAGAGRVYAAARDPEQLRDQVAADPDRVVPVMLDMRDAASVEAAARQVGAVDLLINNAGALTFGNLLDMPMEDVERNMDVNYLGTLRVVRAFAPLMGRDRDAAIVNTLSIGSFSNIQGLGAYGASKAASWSMTQAIRASLAPRRIAVHAVFPGPVDTDMARDIPMAKASPADVARAIVDGVVAGREDILPDAVAEQVYAGWRQDHKAVERQFAAM